jgi:hypothetical protein
VNSLLKHRNTHSWFGWGGLLVPQTFRPAGAQTATPVPPTAVPTIPVSIDLPVGVIFSETNNWIEQFAPLAAIGIGITIALAVLGYLGHMIVSAFKG